MIYQVFKYRTFPDGKCDYYEFHENGYDVYTNYDDEIVQEGNHFISKTGETKSKVKFYRWRNVDYEVIDIDDKKYAKLIIGYHPDYDIPNKHKYVYATSIEDGYLHLHVALTGIPGINEKSLIMGYWSYGFVDVKPLCESGDYKRIANYIIKNTDKSFRTGEAGMRRRYQTSRNLVRPKWEVEEEAGNDWDLDPDIPKGYQLIDGSLVNGFNAYDGKMYQSYRLLRQRSESKKGRLI